MRVTLRDIAKRVNLSHATVSFVLNERMDVSIPASTRERVMAVAKEMGYRPNRAAQALVRGRTNMVALWLPLDKSIHYTQAQFEFAALAAKDGFELITRLFDFAKSGGGHTWEVDDWPVDGILMLDCFKPSIAEYAAPSEVPLVSVGIEFDRNYDHVGVDISGGIRDAISHLAGAGCQRIAYLTCDEAAEEEPRLATYVAECAARRLVKEIIKAPSCTRSMASSRVREHIANAGAPHGIIAQSDALALAARRGLADEGLEVPKDVLLVGCDGSEEGEFSVPAVSSITHPESEMCARAWQVLQEKISGMRKAKLEQTLDVKSPGSIHSEVLTARLAIRDSSIRA